MSEAKFVISKGFTTIRGDSWEEFVNNMRAAFPNDYETVIATAMNEVRASFGLAGQPQVQTVTVTGLPTEAQAVQVLQNTLGAVPVPQNVVPLPQQQVVQQPPAINGPVPTCIHGPKKYVPAGVSGPNSRNPGTPFNAFWACEAPKGQQKCRD